LKTIFEAGLIFRGYTLVNRKFKDFIAKESTEIHEDLRASFISAITEFCEYAFMGSSLEYLVSKDILIIFTTDTINADDFPSKEPILAYAICDKKKNVDRQVRSVVERLSNILIYFIQRYNNQNLSETTQFNKFKRVIEDFFIRNKKVTEITSLT